MSRTTGAHVIRWCGEEARTSPWRGNGDVAFLTPLAGAVSPSPAFVRRCLEELAADGFSQVVTSALGPFEQAAFLGAGFQVQERLTVLTHDLVDLPPSPELSRGTLRRGRPDDLSAVLDLDHRAFQPFWQLDEVGIDDALTATPHVRYRVATTGAERAGVVGYAITGRASQRGFLQRLAVHPDHRGEHLGTALVLDGLRWLRRWRVERAVVNTQPANLPALALYRRLGFRPDPSTLSVLSAVLGS